MSLSSSLSTTSSSGSAFEAEDSENCVSPTPQTVGASLDEYVCASKVGRAAFASGDLKTAVEQFDQALRIELQTEMDCLYDTSLGFVSGLVRQEVESRLLGNPKHTEGPPTCEGILEKLADVYTDAEKQLTAKPTEVKSYLQMGSCLCVANAWDQARRIYMEGLNMCKEPRDRKQLGSALRNLTRIERIVSGEHQPEPYVTGTYAPWKPKPVAVPKKPKRHFSISLSPRRHKSRPKSQVVVEPPDFEEDMTDLPVNASFNGVPSNPPPIERSRTMSDPPTPAEALREKVKRKRFGFSLKKKRHSASFPVRQPEPSIDCEERQSWLEAFSAESGMASGCQGFCPSAIIHMRRLSLESLTPAASSRPVAVTSSVPSYTAVKFQSIQIEGDDSEIEDF